jgi:hypothetical protein
MDLVAGSALLLVATTLIAGVSPLTLASPAASADAARSQKLEEHAQLRLVKKTGTRFQHRGTARGTLDGDVTSTITLSSLSLAGVVKITTKGGSLTLQVKGTARSGGLRSRFDGTVTVKSGTGRYARARGRGRFQGVVNRRTWAATLDATGVLSL